MVSYHQVTEEDFDELALLLSNQWATPEIKNNPIAMKHSGLMSLFFFMVHHTFTCVAEDEGKVIGLLICTDVKKRPLDMKYAKLLIGEGLDKLLLDIRVKIRECVRSQLLRQDPKGYGKLLYLKFRECSGDISFVLFAEYRSKVVQLLLVDQFFYFLFDEFFLHLTHRLSLYS